MTVMKLAFPVGRAFLAITAPPFLICIVSKFYLSLTRNIQGLAFENEDKGVLQKDSQIGIDVPGVIVV